MQRSSFQPIWPQEIMGCIPVKLGRARNRNDARQFLSQYADAAKKMADARYGDSINKSGMRTTMSLPIYKITTNYRRIKYIPFAVWNLSTHIQSTIALSMQRHTEGES